MMTLRFSSRKSPSFIQRFALSSMEQQRQSISLLPSQLALRQTEATTKHRQQRPQQQVAALRWRTFSSVASSSSSSSSSSYGIDSDILTYCLTHTMIANDHDHAHFLRNMDRLLFLNSHNPSPNNSNTQLPDHQPPHCQPKQQVQQQRSFEQKQQKQESSLTIDDMPLPTTWNDAVSVRKKRAIVITECQPPYRITYVNDGWCLLCGYTYQEALHRTIGSLIHGPKTNPLAATALLSKLMMIQPEGSYSDNDSQYDIGTTIINYRQDGTPFLNRIRVGPLYEDDNIWEHDDLSSSSRSQHENKKTKHRHKSYSTKTTATTSPPIKRITHYVGLLQEIPMES